MVWLGLGLELVEILYGNVLLLSLVLTKTSLVNLSPSLSENKSWTCVCNTKGKGYIASFPLRPLGLHAQFPTDILYTCNSPPLHLHTNTSYPGRYSLEDCAGHFHPSEERLAYTPCYSRSSSTTKVTAQRILILQKTRIIRNVYREWGACRLACPCKSLIRSKFSTARQYFSIAYIALPCHPCIESLPTLDLRFDQSRIELCPTQTERGACRFCSWQSRFFDIVRLQVRSRRK